MFWRGFIATLLIGSYVLMRRLPLAVAVTLNYTSPLFLALLLAPWLKEPVRRGFYAVLAAGFVGVIFLL